MTLNRITVLYTCQRQCDGAPGTFDIDVHIYEYNKWLSAGFIFPAHLREVFGQQWKFPFCVSIEKQGRRTSGWHVLLVF